ncbi:hypothetical protein [Pontiella sp.]|uniref:hypothetical protein n=1 Tax=Pontiella sp. TaxID=2837462 RepID=UPI0035669ED5
MKNALKNLYKTPPLAIRLLLLAALLPAAARAAPEPTDTVSVDNCDLYIYKADSSLNDFRNPVLFVEGFDFYNDRDWEDLYTQFNGENLIEELRSLGFDVLLLSFEDATKKLSDNQAKMVKVIDYINNHRMDTGETETFTLIGAGMGGLASRMALAEMEQAGNPHYVDTWISLDAPHEGANIPLGIQEYLEFCELNKNAEPGFDLQVELLDALDRDAFKGMLLVHHLADDGLAAPDSKRAELIAELAGLGYPTNCKTMAISNGSGYGKKQPFSPGEQIMHLENPALPTVYMNIYALPQTTDGGQTGSDLPLFQGVYYEEDGYKVEHSSHYPYAIDNAPGGTSDLFYELFAGFPYPDGSDSCSYSNHCMVSTTSSLGIPIRYIDTDLSAHPEILALSPFDEIHYALANEPHMEINARNKEWILQAVLEEVDTVEVDKCDLYIYKADNRLPGLHNPVLFVEGFDFYNDQNWDALYARFNQNNLIEELRSHGRDVLIFSFEDATKKLWDNRAKTITALEYINGLRVALDESDKFTVVGAGMGGLASRMALADMEAGNTPHYVDTWISFDAPHEGANIPLGLQKYLDFCKDNKNNEPGFEAQTALIHALDRDAYKGMLLVHHTSDDGLAAPNSKRADLITELSELGYPTNCKTIAISNGSGSGEKQPFSPGEQMMYLENPLLPWIEFNIYALPQTPADGQTAGEQFVFKGLYYIVDGNEVENSSHYPYAIDNAPGSTSDLLYQLFSSFGYPDGSDYCTYSNHCVVSTTSSLGIPIEHIDTDLSAHPEIRALSPFDEIHYAVGNEPHMEINDRNKAWFMRAVLEDYDSDGDGLDDYQEYLIGTDPDTVGGRPSAQSELSRPAGNAMALSFNALENVQYSIWFTEALDQPWELLDTIPPSSLAAITNTYDIVHAEGYFKITGEIFDPVTDQN